MGYATPPLALRACGTGHYRRESPVEPCSAFRTTSPNGVGVYFQSSIKLGLADGCRHQAVQCKSLLLANSKTFFA